MSNAHAEPLPPTILVPAPLDESSEQIDQAPAQPPTAAPQQGLGRAATMGFVLMSGQSVLTRVLSFGSQIVLAHYLTTAQFGLNGLAMAIVNYANLSQQVGVREILVSRQKRMHVWANAGFWIATVTGVLSMLLILGAAPIAGWFYGDRTLMWMLVILAVAQPAYNMTLVQEAKLQSHLRFRYIALTQFVWGALMPLLQLFFAVIKFGAYAFVVPRLLAGLVRWWMFERSEPIVIKRDWQLRRWRYILAPGFTLLLTALAYTIGPSVPALMLGRYVSKESTGCFTLAFNLSLQVIMLLSMQIDSVLFPTLGKMEGEPERQRDALLRSSRALMAVMAPICLLPIAAAEPIVLLMFGHKWTPAIEALQIMSVGMLAAGGFIPALSLLQAQRRFKDKLIISLQWAMVSAVSSIVGILLVPAQDAVSAAAVGLSIGYLGYGIDTCVAATRPLGGGIRDAVRVIAMPLIVGGLATALAWGSALLALTLLPAAHGSRWLGHVEQLAVIGVVGGITYPVLLRLMAPALWADLMKAGEPVLRRFRAMVPGNRPESAA